jgi:hypothetical protein
MEERSQGAIEYLMMLAAVLVVAASVIYLIFSTSSSMGADVGGRIDNIRDNIIDKLTSSLIA